MSLREAAITIAIRAKDLASGTLAKVKTEVTGAGKSSDKAADQVEGFSEQLTEADREADRFIDSAGRMREANGKFVKGLEETNSALSSTSKSTGALSKGFDFVKGKFLALASAGAALAGFGGAVQASREFEAQLSRVGAITNATASDMDKLKQAAEDAGSSTRYNSTQAAEGLEILARAGFSASDSIRLLPTLLNVATAEGLDLAQAAGLVTDTLSIMGLEIEQAGNAADILAKGAQLSNTTMEQLGNAISYSGQYAKESGLSLEKLTAILDLLAKNGLRGERAGTGLRTVLAQLQDPASKAAKAVTDLGLDISDFEGVIDGLKSSGDKAKDAINAFGVEAGPALRALIASGTKGLKEYEDQLNNAAGTAQEMAEKVSDNLDGAAVSFSSMVDTLKKKLADPILEPLTRDIRDITASLKAMTPAVEVAGSSISFVYDRLSGLVRFFGNAFSIALTSVTTVGAQIPVLLKQIELSVSQLGNKVGLVTDEQVRRVEVQVGALKAARDALAESVVEDAYDAREALKLLIGVVDESAAKGKAAGEDAAEAITEVGNAAEKSADKVSEVAEALDEVSAKSGETKQSVIDDFNAIASNVESSGEDIRNAFVNAINSAKTTEEISVLKDQFWQLFYEGEIGAGQLASGMERVDQAVANLTESAKAAQTEINGIGLSNSGISEYLKKLDEAAESQAKKTQATKDDTAATTANTEAVNKNAGDAAYAAEKASTMAGYTYKLAGLARDQWVAMGQSMADAFDGFVSKTQEYQKQITQYGNRTAHAFLYLMNNAYSQAADQADRLKKRYDAQNRSAERFIERLSDSSVATAELAEEAESALSRFDLLDDQTLSSLKSAIAAVKAETESLNSSLSSTLNNLRDELDSLNDDQLAIETRAYKSQLEDLQAQLERAQELGSTEAIKSAREAIQLLKETYRIKKQNIQDETSSSTSDSTDTSSSTTTSRTVNISIGGTTRSVAVADAASEASLLAALESIGEVTV
jgi:TP901 family phage tail tape measure protein